MDFFLEYENEFGLLEILPGWIFVEWSMANAPDFVSGVNFPSNMLYAMMLDAAANLLGRQSYSRKADKIRSEIIRLAFDGEFFRDNALRENGSLVTQSEHITETCQYYALFTGIKTSADYDLKIMNEFGPGKGKNFPNVHKSNMFIGNYLRLLWLCRKGEYKKVLDESVDYFYCMAEKTGTLWENDTPSASCNHGFASVIAPIIMECLFGYKTVRNFEPVTEKHTELIKGISAIFSYPEKSNRIHLL